MHPLRYFVFSLSLYPKVLPNPKINLLVLLSSNIFSSSLLGELFKESFLIILSIFNDINPLLIVNINSCSILS